MVVVYRGGYRHPYSYGYYHRPVIVARPAVVVAPVYGYSWYHPHYSVGGGYFPMYGIYIICSITALICIVVIVIVCVGGCRSRREPYVDPGYDPYYVDPYAADPYAADPYYAGYYQDYADPYGYPPAAAAPAAPASYEPPPPPPRKAPPPADQPEPASVQPAKKKSSQNQAKKSTSKSSKSSTKNSKESTKSKSSEPTIPSPTNQPKAS